MIKGTLSVVGGGNNKKVQVNFLNSKQQYVQKTIFEKGTLQIQEDQLSTELVEKFSSDINQLKNLKVEFEEEGDRFLKMREQGQPWDREILKTTSERVRPQEQPKRVQGDRFHNPYNFVPALPRDQVTGELGDRAPVGHGRYLPECWSGRISVKLTTVTPLLIPDAAEMTEDNNGHKTYPVRLGVDGKPYLPPTSIKGMLRSAYEAVTNSRLAVFEKHDARLAYRMPATIGLQMVPARIVGDTIHLCPGTSEIGQDGKPRGAMYAAWLPRYDRNTTEPGRFAVRYPDGSLPQHGDHVRFWAEKFGKFNRSGNVTFTYWKVRTITRFSDTLTQQPQPSNGNGNHRPIDNEIRKFEGYVYVTNKNIGNKHDERIFIVNDSSFKLPLKSNLKQKWEELIVNYQEIHKEEIRKGLEAPPALNGSRWSRQVVSGKAEQTLKDGTLCYAHVRRNDGKYEILNLYPVMITRGLFEQSPIQLLDASLRPAKQKSELSPADRVFGWVNQEGKGSYKGHLRVHSVTCLSHDPVDDFGSESATFPLTILGQPKPQQARFYCADERNGKPLENNSDKDEGYKYDDQALRGRKVYPHHKGLPENYWNDPTTDRTDVPVNGHYQEYRQPDNNGRERSDQNRSIKNWVKPGTEFQFDIDVTNLSTVELGALLWLLYSPDVHYHRLGGAKPLGFGSVWIEVEQLDLRLGSDWANFYQSLTPLPVSGTDALASIEAYKTTVVQAYGKGQTFEKISIIAAFCQSTQGFDDNAAIHYPRSTAHPTPDGEAFKWFVENERTGHDNPGKRLSLPPLYAPQPLPVNPIN